VIPDRTRLALNGTVQGYAGPLRVRSLCERCSRKTSVSSRRRIAFQWLAVLKIRESCPSSFAASVGNSPTEIWTVRLALAGCKVENVLSREAFSGAQILLLLSMFFHN
jgi:hypothetical protein